MWFSKETYIKILKVLYIAIFIWSAIAPKDYSIWILEIVGVIITILFYYYFNKSIQFSTTTNTWFFISVCLMTIGAHYSFPDVPIFDQMKGWFGIERNNYDKIGHLVQGILPVLISREVLVKKSITSDIYWNNLISFCVAMTVTAVYELVEWLFIILFGDNNYTYDVLGTQGYIWDAQSDMLFAMIGALLAIFLGHKHLVAIVKTNK